MADAKLETVEPDPSSTGIANDTSINTNEMMEKSNPTADASAKIEINMPSTEDVDKAIAEVESRKLQKEGAKDVKVEANGHEAPVQKDDKVEGEKKEPSKRVQEGQKWNNRDRHGQPQKSHKNYISDLTSQAESSDPVEIRKQVEFYFSDSNLLQDRFLFQQVQGHENLPIPVSTIHSFKRMRHFQPYSAVVEALKDSATLNVVGDDLIQRKTALPEGLKDKPMDEIQKVFEDETMKRSVYVKGFGEEQPSTQFDIEAFFAHYGPTNSVRLRRTLAKMFKGSVFVEFDSEETQKKFLSLEPRPKWKGQDLLIKSKKQYCDDKVEEIKAGRVEAHGDDRDWKTRRNEDQRNGHKRGGGGKGFGSHRGGRGRGGRGGNRRERDDDRRPNRDERNVPKVATTADPEKEVGKATAKAVDASSELDAVQAVPNASDNTGPDSGSKKRAREEDGESEEGQAAKKVDTKADAP
ncbi:MAG: hypothetical protein LQ339_007156 [Xanthoria mediterranea]|nr:MAG: hypothetical protein LQ339_007156 [Xanthoria mediterranea]